MGWEVRPIQDFVTGEHKSDASGMSKNTHLRYAVIKVQIDKHVSEAIKRKLGVWFNENTNASSDAPFYYPSPDALKALQNHYYNGETPAERMRHLADDIVNMRRPILTPHPRRGTQDNPGPIDDVIAAFGDNRHTRRIRW